MSIFIALTICSCGDDEPETKEYFVVYIDETCIGGVENTSPECQQWKAQNEKYQDGSGTAPNGYMKSWTRYFYDTESAVKQWCNKVNGFSIIKSETRQDKFNARYDKTRFPNTNYVPVNSN